MRVFLWPLFQSFLSFNYVDTTHLLKLGFPASQSGACVRACVHARVCFLVEGRCFCMTKLCVKNVPETKERFKAAIGGEGCCRH